MPIASADAGLERTGRAGNLELRMGMAEESQLAAHQLFQIDFAPVPAHQQVWLAAMPPDARFEPLDEAFAVLGGPPRDRLHRGEQVLRAVVHFIEHQPHAVGLLALVVDVGAGSAPAHDPAAAVPDRDRAGEEPAGIPVGAAQREDLLPLFAALHRLRW